MANSLTILQGGYWKSGNHLLFRVLKEILQYNQAYHTFYLTSGISDVISALCQDYLNFGEQAEVPMLFVKTSDPCFEFPHPAIRFFHPKLDLVLRSSTIIWSHERLSALEPILSRFSHKVFIVRDHAEVLNSFIHHHVRPTVLRLHPEYQFNTAEELLQRYDIFEKYVAGYRRYLEDLLSYVSRRSGDTLLLTYRSLADAKAKTVMRVAQFLGLEVDVPAVLENTSFARAKAENPAHARSGDPADHRRYFNSRHYNILKGCESLTTALQAHEGH